MEFNVDKKYHVWEDTFFCVALMTGGVVMVVVVVLSSCCSRFNGRAFGVAALAPKNLLLFTGGRRGGTGVWQKSIC